MTSPLTHRSRAAMLLRQWRQNGGCSGIDAAARFGLAKSTYYRFEAGEREFPDAMKRAMVDIGICDFADFFAAVQEAA